MKAAAWDEPADRFDAALVAAPHAFRSALGLGPVRAGKHVAVEKPLAIVRPPTWDEMLRHG